MDAIENGDTANRLTVKELVIELLFALPLRPVAISISAPDSTHRTSADVVFLLRGASTLFPSLLSLISTYLRDKKIRIQL